MTIHNLEQISFHGDLLWAGREGDEVLVALKPICQNLTLQWHGQLERAKRDAILAKGIRVIRIPSPGGEQETICLTLSLIAGWLFGIDDRRIKDPDIRAKVLDYKHQCHDVLYKHFLRRSDDLSSEALAQEDDEPIAPFGSQQWLVEIAMVRESRRIYGVMAARKLWQQLGLPSVPEMFPTEAAIIGVPGDAAGVESFIAERCLNAPGARTRLLDLWQAYVIWCEPRGISPVVMQTFGKAATSRWTKRKASITWYIGVTLRPAPAPSEAGGDGTTTIN